MPDAEHIFLCMIIYFNGLAAKIFAPCAKVYHKKVISEIFLLIG